MDAPCEIQRSIHVFRLVNNMCPGKWVHIIGGPFSIDASMFMYLYLSIDLCLCTYLCIYLYLCIYYVKSVSLNTQEGYKVWYN